VPRKIGQWYQYCGAIHIHTTESDGTRSLSEVIALGQEVGLEFMMFTDHMNLRNRENGGEGYHGKTLVTIGYEHNDRDDHHHYLLFDTPGVYSADLSPAEYVATGVVDGALGIIAHPDEIRKALPEHPAYPWTDWTVSGFTGIELWNQMSEWMEKLTRYNKLVMAFSPRKSLVAPTPRILKKWDEINLNRQCVGIAGADAHAFRIKAGPFTVEVFPYKVHFRSLRCYVLIPEKLSTDFDTAKQQLYDAIRDCRLFFANTRWGAADRFEFRAESSAGRAVIGQQIRLAEDLRLRVHLPSKATLRLVHNGQAILTTLGSDLDYLVKEEGIYRVEAFKGKRGWIFSNHIRVEG